MTAKYNGINKIHILAVMVSMSVIVSCQGSDPTKRSNDGSAGAGGANAAAAGPSVSPEANPSPSAAPQSSASCDVQWQQYVSHFKVGAKLTYSSSVTYTPVGTAVAKKVPAVHTEEVSISSDEQVVRLVTLTSTDPEVSTLLNVFKLVPKISLKKDAFLKLCDKASNIATNTVSFSGGNVQVLENRDEAITSQGQQVTAHYLKLKGDISNVPLLGVTSDIEVWMSKDIPGLVLRQTSVLANAPVIGTVTFNDELSGSSGM